MQIEVEDKTRKVPSLTLPHDEANYFTNRLKYSKVYLEYGSGGSTLLAAEIGVQRLFSVESDRAWIGNLSKIVRERFLNLAFIDHYIDIGKTGDWGFPLDSERARHWPDYARSIWMHAAFQSPDLILIDGRFRVSCFLASVACCTTETTILFDD
jgi:hypothetical protein